ncbi:MAG: transposase [Terriglobales bacterium]
MLRKYQYRRTLPHYQKDNKAIFATFSTHRRWPLPETAREIVVEACRHLDGTMCTLHGFVVMPDHVHLVFTPMTDSDGPISLPEILQKVKSESAHRINKLLGRKGRVWQDESFDHVLRREEGIDAKLEYIRLNPVRAALVQQPGEYRWMWFEKCGRVWGRASVGAGDLARPVFRTLRNKLSAGQGARASRPRPHFLLT